MRVSLAGALLALSGLGFTFLLGRRISSSVQNLKIAAVNVVEGRAPPAAAYPIAELQDVTSVFDYAASLNGQRQEAEQRLRDSEARYRSALTVGRIASWETNFVTRQRHWSREGEALFGIALQDGIGSVGGAGDEYRNALHPDDRHLMEHFHQFAKAEDSFTAEYRIVHPDGQVFWVSGRGQVVARDPAGKPERMISVVADITDRKLAEEHVKFLMGEMAHRSKNLMTVIQSLATQTARSAFSMQDFSERFRRRLQGLAISQDLLVQQNWQRISLEDLVRQQLASFVERNSLRLHVCGPIVYIHANHAQALGLALHELATNAAKYGALSSPTGKVVIERRIVSNSRDQLLLTWNEVGGPSVTPPLEHGFGHKMIKTMVAQSVNGEVTIDYAPEGYRWSVLFSTTGDSHPDDTVDVIAGSSSLPTSSGETAHESRSGQR